jgi:hypothetical protein
MKVFPGITILASILAVFLQQPLLAAPVAVPKDLQDWQPWVLDGHEAHSCPYFSSAEPNEDDSHVCAWPARLNLDLNAHGGKFSQAWQLYSESWVPLPGSKEHWPQGVTVNGKSAAVVERGGVPQLRLVAGSYQLAGSFSWESRPESLAVPAQAGLVALSLDGRVLPQADRPDGAVWLGKRRGAEQAQSLVVQVYRLLEDQLPARLITQIRVQVAGDGREEVFSTVLPAGFTPMSLNSTLPARIDGDGRLRVQVRAGNWEINLAARGADSAQKIVVPAVNGVWPKQEVWSYSADDRLRVSAIEGAEGIDPVQANVQPGWRQYPAFRLAPGGALQVIERSRGLSVQDANKLSLRRAVYLDFDHSGYTVVDQLSGQMRTGWRLDMMQPYSLESASHGGENLLVTQGSSAGQSGIELRSPQFALETIGRLHAAGGSVPATGWSERFEQVAGVLHLPPGHRLLAALGADSAPGAWIERWGLLDLFLLLISGAIALRLHGPVFAAVTLVAVALVHQENSLLVWLLLYVLVAVAALRVAPRGWPHTALYWIRNALYALLVLALVPFAVMQVRYAVYPQLADAEPYGFAALGKAATAPAADAEPAPLEQIVVTGARADRPPPPEVPSADAVSEEVQTPEAVNMPVSSAPASNPYGAISMYKRSVASSLQRYAPGSLVQSGPGRPRWSFVRYDYSWSGPVETGQSVHFLVLTPFWVSLWRVLGVVLMVWIALALLRGSGELPAQWQRLLTWRRGGASATALLMLLFAAPDSRAGSTPDTALLKELQTRLLRAPECEPSCADIQSAGVILQPANLEVQLQISALTTVAVPLPAAAGRFEPETLSIDGTPVAGVYRDSTHRYWIALKPGAHQVRVAGRLPPADSIQLLFPLVPHGIVVSGSGWDVSGINEGRLVANTLELVRRRVAAGGAEGAETSAQFPAFVRVRRDFQFDLDWSIATTAQRLAPEKGGFTLQLPLLAGESVLTPGMEARGGKNVLVGFDSSAGSVSWQSGLAHSDSFTLTAPKGSAWTEVWSFNISPMWRVEFNGLPAVNPENLDPSNWSYEYHPRPGESLTLKVSRPVAASGATLAIDNVELSSQVGKRATESSLSMGYRSTQGGRHTLQLPLDAQVSAVSVDGNPVQVRPDRGELPLAVLPGAHRIEVEWQRDTGASLLTRAPAVNLGSASSNIILALHMPADRWVLFAGGAGVGPAILYWGELLVFIALAALLSRSRHSPLKMHEWLLLGLGLSTFSWSVLLLFAVWVFAIRWRTQANTAAIADTRFNLMQLLLILLSVATVLSVVAAIPNALLATPDMRIAGGGQSADGLSWFNDLAAGALPTPWVLSLSLWWYKLAMLLWALWLAFALVRWVPMAWHGLTAGGFWRRARTDTGAASAEP